MGCGSSREIPNSDQNQKPSGNKLHDKVRSNQEMLKLDDGNLNTKIDSPSPIELVQDSDNHFEGPDITVEKQTLKTQGKRISIDSGVTSDAWTTGKLKPGEEQDKWTNENENDSEFGRDGIDFCSYSFDGIRKKSAGKRKPSPKGIQPENEPHETDFVPRLTKKFSEEPFDPSVLINVDKFKAVNTAKQVDTNGTVAIETNMTSAQIGPQTIVSPSNYHDFYDEDEKALMESIEKDFTETAYTTLPGVVA